MHDSSRGHVCSSFAPVWKTMFDLLNLLVEDHSMPLHATRVHIIKFLSSTACEFFLGISLFVKNTPRSEMLAAMAGGAAASMPDDDGSFPMGSKTSVSSSGSNLRFGVILDGQELQALEVRKMAADAEVAWSNMRKRTMEYGDLTKFTPKARDDNGLPVRAHGRDGDLRRGGGASIAKRSSCRRNK